MKTGWILYETINSWTVFKKNWFCNVYKQWFYSCLQTVVLIIYTKLVFRVCNIFISLFILAFLPSYGVSCYLFFCSPRKRISMF